MSAASVEAQFSASVTILLGLLDKSKVRRRRLQVAISDHWTRPLVLSLTVKPQNDQAVDALLHSHYRKIYGDLMDNWRWCWTRHGARLVAVALPGRALDALQTGLAQRDCVLSSARPLGLLLGSQLSNEPGACWLVILMGFDATLMRLQNGFLQDWCVVTGAADAHSLAAQLPVQLVRETARRGDNCRAVVIVDFAAAIDLPAVRDNLLGGGWASRVCAATELSSAWVWDLQRLTRLQQSK
jgi:hypothetical protein